MSIIKAQADFNASRRANLRNQAGSLLHECKEHHVTPAQILDMYIEVPQDLLYALVLELWVRLQDAQS